LSIAYLGLGSNLGDRQAALREALDRLDSGASRILRRSSIYETEPRDLPDQPWFLNQVVEIDTTLSPFQLLAAIQKTEQEMGRERGIPKGPRTIDVDILLYADQVIHTSELAIPHPRLAERRFVLEPLAELIPEFTHPVTHQTIAEMLGATADQVVKLHQGQC